MRRSTFVTGAAAVSISSVPRIVPARESVGALLVALERSSGGRLGVYAFDAAGGAPIAHRAAERFPMCSTFKFLAVAAVLQRVDQSRERLDRQVRFTKGDLLGYAPVSRKNVAAGVMSVGTMCAAAIEYSDNTAANLLLGSLGGPHAVTAFARSLGDGVTRLDRTEPWLNAGIPGDPRDTTAPRSMADDMRAILLGPVLSAASRAKLAAWMVDCKTGSTCLRAGFPHSWRVADKTGAGGPVNAVGASDTRNDIAIAWRPRGAPVVVTAYLTGSRLTPDGSDSVLASVGRIVAARLQI